MTVEDFHRRLPVRRVSIGARFVQRLLTRAFADDVPGLAAELSYQFLFALFPFFLFLAALLGFVGAHTGRADLFTQTMQFIATLAPTAVQQVIREWVYNVVYTQSTELVSAGIALCLFGSTAGIGTLGKGLNRAHRVHGGRPLWLGLLLALLITVALAATMLVGVMAFTLGQWAGPQLARDPRLAQGFLDFWELLRGPVLLVGLFAVLAVVYRVLPTARVTFRQALPGAAFAALAWFTLLHAFSFYLAHFGIFGPTYGALSVVIVLLVWLYAVSVILLVGGEINAMLMCSLEV